MKRQGKDRCQMQRLFALGGEVNPCLNLEAYGVQPQVIGDKQLCIGCTLVPLDRAAAAPYNCRKLPPWH